MSLALWAIAVLPSIALAMTFVNALSWRRGQLGTRFGGKVSVLVPARNEAARLADCLRAIAASAHPIHEIIVFDDDSTDGTAQLLADLRAELPLLRVVRGSGLPAGWVGKPHACQRLADAATGDVLVFLDADVLLSPEGLERLASFFRAPGADVVTATPRQLTGSTLERWVVPFLLLSYLSWLPLELVSRTRDPRVLAANGQILALRADALRALNGFRSVAQEIVDDVAFCRHAKRRGLRVAFADGTLVASCRMYGSARGVWEGFSKNIHEGVGGSLALALVVLVYLATFVAPGVLLLVAALGAQSLLAPAALAVAANVAQRALVCWRWNQAVSGLIAHPAAALVVVAIACNSLWWSLRGEILWAGRRYAGRAARKGAA